eukprot:6158379-Prymnesium_polylepis.1
MVFRVVCVASCGFATGSLGSVLDARLWRTQKPTPRQRTRIKDVRSRKTILAPNQVFDHREARGGEPPWVGKTPKSQNEKI